MKEITLKTKFDLGDTVYFIDSRRKIQESRIVKIDFDITKEGSSVYYKLSPFDYVKEEHCFASREELIASL